MFRQDSFDNHACFDMFYFHYEWWSRIVWGERVPSVSDIYRSLIEVTVASQPVVARPDILWAPPEFGIIKVNADESIFSTTSSSGIWGGGGLCESP